MDSRQYYPGMTNLGFERYFWYYLYHPKQTTFLYTPISECSAWLMPKAVTHGARRVSRRPFTPFANPQNAYHGPTTLKIGTWTIH